MAMQRRSFLTLLAGLPLIGIPFRSARVALTQADVNDLLLAQLRDMDRVGFTEIAAIEGTIWATYRKDAKPTHGIDYWIASRDQSGKYNIPPEQPL